MKKIAGILVSMMAGAVIFGSLSYFDLIPNIKYTKTESADDLKEVPQVMLEKKEDVEVVAETEDEANDLEVKIDREIACRKASEIMSQIKDQCGMMPFPGVDECITQRIDRAKVENEEENLSRANKMRDLNVEYTKLNTDCE